MRSIHPFPIVKKHHILLVLLIAGTAAFQLNEARVLKNMESGTRAELAMLRDAVAKSRGPEGSSPLSRKGPGSRIPAIDPQALLADLKAVSQGGPGGDLETRMKELGERYEKQLAAAPLAKLKEICELLEKEFPLDQEGSEQARHLWQGVLGMAARSDPAWAFAKLEQAASSTKAPITAVLDHVKRWASQDGEPMSRSYAKALVKWLDAAQADGRIDPNHPLVAELRAGVATAQNNPSAAALQISQLPFQSQRQAAVDHLIDTRIIK